MLIDWFTVAAQALNFLVLVVVLKVVLYDRILRAIDTREARITARLEDAARQRREAETAAAALRAERAELDQRAAALLAEARQAAADERRDLVRRARDEVAALRASWEASLAREQQRVLAELQERVGRQVCEVSRRVLADLADADLERQVLVVAARRLEADPSATRDLADAVAGGATPVVATAFPLDDDARRQVTEIVRRQLPEGPPPTFTTDPTLVCGLEVRAGGHAVGWSVASHLDGLEAAIAEVLPTVDVDPAGGVPVGREEAALA